MSRSQTPAALAALIAGLAALLVAGAIFVLGVRAPGPPDDLADPPDDLAPVPQATAPERPRVPRAAAPEEPVVRVEVRAEGMSPEEVESLVAAPVEKALAGLAGLEAVRSHSREGACTVAAHFRPGTDGHAAAQEVLNAVSGVVPGLPAGVGQPSVSRDDPDELPAMWVWLTSDRHSVAQLADVFDEVVRPGLEGIPGLDRVEPVGLGRRAVHVWLDPDRLRAFNLSAGEVVRALESQAPDVAAAKVADLVVARRQGQAVYLRDAAVIEEGRTQPAVLFGPLDRREVGAALWRAGGADPGGLNRHLAEAVTRLREKLPEGVFIARSDFNEPASDPLLTEPRLLVAELGLPAGTSLQELGATLERAGRALHHDEVAPLMRTEGRAGAPPTARVVLPTEFSVFDFSGEKAHEVRSRLAEALPGVAVRVLELPADGGPLRLRYPIRLELLGPDRQELARWANRVVLDLTDQELAIDVATSVRPARPSVRCEIDRAKAAESKVAVRDIADSLRLALGGIEAAVGGAEGRRTSLRVALRRPAREGRTPEAFDLEGLFVPSADGGQVPLASVVRVGLDASPEALDRRGGRPCVAVTANPPPGGGAAEAAVHCRQAAEAARKALGLSDEYQLAD